jgi:lipoteichoic acid synthase
MPSFPTLTVVLTIVTIVSAALLIRARIGWKDGAQPPTWAQAVLPSWMVANILLKSALAMGLISSDLSPGWGPWLWSTGFLVCLVALSCLLPQRLADLACWLFAATLSLLLWGDVLYYRQFQDFLMVNHFVYLWAPDHQGPAQAANIQLTSLIKPSDRAFWLDLPVVFLLIWIAPRVPSVPRRTLRWLPTIIFPLFVLGNLFWLVQADYRTREFLENRLYNRSHVRNNGLVAYHLYDVYHWIRPRLAPPDPLPDDIIRERLALSAQSIGPSYTGFGCAPKANVIIVQLESFQYFLIDLEVDGQEVTPFLNSLRSECLYGNALDQTASGSTSDAMFVMLNSLQPPSGGPFCFLFPTISTRALPRILGERGWNTLHVMSYDGAFWNTRIMGDHFGFDEQVFTQDLPAPARGESVGWGLSDAALFSRVMDLFKERQKPFLCYITTTMMHYPFLELRPHQRQLKLPSHLEQTMAGRYLHLARFRDQALEFFIRRLQEEGLWDNSIVVFCGDHRSRLPEAEFDRLETPELEPVRSRLPLFIHVPDDSVRGDLAELSGQLDVAPTVLHLLGIDDAGQVFLGRNVLAGAHASASPYGYISDGTVALWSQDEGGEDRLVRLSDSVQLPLTDPRSTLLRRQLNEEVQVSDTLMFGNRILEFSKLADQR